MALTGYASQIVFQLMVVSGFWLTQTSSSKAMDDRYLYTDEDVKTSISATIACSKTLEPVPGKTYLLKPKGGTQLIFPGQEGSPSYYVALLEGCKDTPKEYSGHILASSIIYHLDKRNRFASDTIIGFLDKLLASHCQKEMIACIKEEERDAKCDYIEEIKNIVAPSGQEKDLAEIKRELKSKKLFYHKVQTDVFDELLAETLKLPNAYYKIVFPFCQNNSHWYVGEIWGEKTGINTYSFTVRAHNPYGNGDFKGTFPEDAALLHQCLRKRLKIENLKVNFEISPFSQRQEYGDAISCGSIMVEDLIKVILSQSLDIPFPYGWGAIDLRIKHLESVEEAKESPSITEEEAKKFLEKNRLWIHEIYIESKTRANFSPFLPLQIKIDRLFPDSELTDKKELIFQAHEGNPSCDWEFMDEGGKLPEVLVGECLKILEEERGDINDRLKALNQHIKPPNKPLLLLQEVDFNLGFKEFLPYLSSLLSEHPLLKPLYDLIEQIKGLEKSETLVSLQDNLQDLNKICEAYREKLILKLQRDFIEQELDSLEHEVIQKTKARQDTITPLVKEINSLISTVSSGTQEKIKEKLSSFGLTADGLQINSVQPASLTLPDSQIDFLREDQPSLDHLFLNPLKQTIKELRILSESSFLEGSPLAIKLSSLSDAYEQAANVICQADMKERIDLLFSVRMRLCRSPHCYFVSERTAKKILSCDDLGVIYRENESGSTAVKSFEGMHFKRNFKKLRNCHLEELYSEEEYFKIIQDDTFRFEGTLDPGMEWGMYTFYTLLMGQGITPSGLIVLQDVSQQVPREGTEAYKELVKILYPATSKADREKAQEKLKSCLRRMSDFKRELKEHALQVSRTIQGVDLNRFLEKHKEKQDFNATNFSAIVLASLLTAASDAKGDNFIVEKDTKRIVGIDNDAALGLFMKKSANSYTVEVRNILLCLNSWMDKPIDETIRQRLLSITPHTFITEWLSLLKDQNSRYTSLAIEGHLNPVTFTNLYLPVRFQKGSIGCLESRLTCLRNALCDKNNLTHQEAFYLLCKPVALYYRAITSNYPISIDGFSPIYHQQKTIEDVLDVKKCDKEDPSFKDALKRETFFQEDFPKKVIPDQALSDEVQEPLITIDLADILIFSENIKEVDFSNTLFKGKNVQVIMALPSLLKLNLSNNNLGFIVLKMLYGHPSLTELDFQRNQPINQEEAQEIVELTLNKKNKFRMLKIDPINEEVYIQPFNKDIFLVVKYDEEKEIQKPSFRKFCTKTFRNGQIPENYEQMQEVFFPILLDILTFFEQENIKFKVENGEDLYQIGILYLDHLLFVKIINFLPQFLGFRPLMGANTPYFYYQNNFKALKFFKKSGDKGYHKAFEAIRYLEYHGYRYPPPSQETHYCILQ